jgi:hypothetical protein
MANFTARPSSKHYLAIYFPMSVTSPCLVWVDSEEVEHEREYFNPKIDQLLLVPGNNRYIGRNLHCVRGNSLRGRKINRDTLNIWYLDDDMFPPVENLITNQSLHGKIPTLVGDAWGEKIWKGPLVAVMKVGSEWDPRLLMDITMTGYRDAIDYLGYYRDMFGSMIDGVGKEHHLGKVILAERAVKVKGVRINCVGDQASRGEPELVPVAVPKTHPLFNLEGDDPFPIPDSLGCSWVAKAYGGGGKVQSSNPSGGDDHVRRDLENPLARLLLLQTSVTNKKWDGLRSWWHDPTIGSILVVNRRGRDIEIGEVRAMCRFIEQVVAPLMTEERALTPDGRREVLAAVTEENLAPFLES